MTRVNARLVLVAATALTLGCDGSGPAERFIVAGPWGFSESVSESNQSVTCSASGTLEIMQTGESFTGSFSKTGFCAGTTGSSSNSASGDILDGQVSEAGVSFEAQPCVYQGSTFGSPPTQMTGSVSCSLQLGGQTVEISGSWQATR